MKKSFTSFFLIWVPFHSSFLVALARNPNTVLNRSDKKKMSIFALFMCIRGKSLSLSPLDVVFAVSFSCMPFIILR